MGGGEGGGAAASSLSSFSSFSFFSFFSFFHLRPSERDPQRQGPPRRARPSEPETRCVALCPQSGRAAGDDEDLGRDLQGVRDARYPTPRELRALLRPLDLFSPNEAEAASLVEGERGRSAALAARSLLLLTADEEGAGGGGGGGATGAGGAETTFLDSVIVRRGGLGAVLVSRGSRDRALSVPAVSGLRLRDTTGCGNAFLGAYAAAAAAAAAATAATAAGSSSVDAALALGVASAAAAAVAEVLGTPALSADLFFPSNAQVERAADRALAVRNACEEVEV